MKFLKKCRRLLKKKGIKVVTGAKVIPETLIKDDGVTINAEHKGEKKHLMLKKCLYL